jgi:predicted Zn-dependent peptidase
MRPDRLRALVCLLALTCALSASAQVRLPPYERVVLDNGAVLFLMPQHEVPIIAFTALVRGGTVAEPEQRRGVAALTAALLERGAGARDAKAFVEAVADVGGELAVAPGLEALNIRGDFLARDRKLMVELLADMLIRPRFEAQELEKLKARAIELIRAAKDSDPRGLIGTYSSAFLFGKHPYGRPIGGDEASLAQVTRDDVVAWYAEQAGADRLLLAVAGDFDAKEMKKLLTAALDDMPKARGALPAVSAAPVVSSRRVLLVDKPDATQTYFWIGNVGVSKRYEARAALELANTDFGGRYTSMLNTELRIRTGLTYGARSSVIQPSQPGSVAIVSYTRTDATGEAIDLALATLARLRSDGLDAGQLDSAKRYLLGQYPLEMETAQQLAAQVATIEFYGLGRAYVDDFAKDVRSVDAAKVREVVAEVYPKPDDLVFILIGNAAAIRDQAAKYGPVTEMSISAPEFTPPRRKVREGSEKGQRRVREGSEKGQTPL